MSEILHEYRTVDKSEWGDGPWQAEPDKVQWIDEATGLDCLIVRGPAGAWCGYVGLPPGHPWHGVDYGQCTLGEQCPNAGDEYPSCYEHEPQGLTEVHGGLTFAAYCQEGAEEHGVCHIPAEGRPDRVWWLGFDCAHSGDLCPKYDKYFKDRGIGHEPGYETYRDRDYVRREVTALAAQLSEKGRPRD
jgi:hypothetical protein